MKNEEYYLLQSIQCILNKMSLKSSEDSTNTNIVSVLDLILSTLNSSVNTTGISNIISSSVGTIAAGFHSVSIFNSGNSNILIKGQVVESGLSIEYTAPLNGTLDAISYNSQLSTILITTLL